VVHDRHEALEPLGDVGLINVKDCLFVPILGLKQVELFELIALHLLRVKL